MDADTVTCGRVDGITKAQRAPEGKTGGLMGEERETGIDRGGGREGGEGREGMIKGRKEGRQEKGNTSEVKFEVKEGRERKETTNSGSER